MVNLGTAIAYLDLDNSGFNNALTNSLQQLNAFTDDSLTIGDKLGALGGSLTTLGKGFTTALTVPLMGAGTAVVKTTTDFDKAMSKVEALSGANTEEMELLREKAKEMGETTAFSAIEAAEAFSYMAMAGWDAESMINGIGAVMNAAAADGIDLARASDIITDAMTAFGLSADESGHFADVLAVAASSSNTSIDMLGESFKYVAPLAGTLNYSVEDIALSLGLMANAGVKSSQAGTALRATISRLSNPTETMVNKLQELGLVSEETGESLLLMDEQGNMRTWSETVEILKTAFADMSEAEQANAASILFGQEAMSGMLAVLNATEEDYDKLSTSINDADGAAKNMADTMLDNLQGSLTLLKSAIEGFAISIGEIIIPKIKDFIDWLAQLVGKLNDLDDKTKITIVQIAVFASAIGPTLLGLGGAFKIIGDGANYFKQLFDIIKGVSGATGIAGIATPVLIVVAAITALVGIIVYLWNTNEDFRKGVIDAWENIKESVKNAIELLKPSLLDLKEAFGKLWDSLQPLIDLIGTVLVEALQLVAPLISALATVLAPILTVLADILTLVADIIALILSPLGGKNGMSEAVEQLKTDFLGMVDTIKGYYDEFTAWLVETTEKAFNDVMEFLGIDYSFKDLIEDIGPGIQAVVTEFNKLKGKISEIASKIKEVFQSKAAEAFKKVLEKLSPLMEDFKNLMKELADDLTPFFEALKEAFEPFIENIGDALIVLADAMGLLVALLSGDEQEISKAVENFKGSLETWKEGALEVFAILGEGIKLALQNVWETLKTWVGEKIQDIKDNIVQTFEDIKEQVVSFFTEKIPQAFEDFMTYLATTPERIGEGISDAILTMDELKTKVDGLLEQLKEVISEKVKALKKELTEWFTDFPNKFDKAMNEARAFVTVKLIVLKNDFKDWWKGVSEYFDTLPDKFKEKASDMMTSFFDGFKSIGEEITKWFNTFNESLLKGIGSVTSALSEVKDTDSSGSYSSGLDYVPYDGYVATLHEGERILTKQENEESKDRISMVQNIYAPTSVNRETLREDTLELLRLAGVY